MKLSKIWQWLFGMSVFYVIRGRWGDTVCLLLIKKQSFFSNVIKYGIYSIVRLNRFHLSHLKGMFVVNICLVLGLGFWIRPSELEKDPKLLKDIIYFFIRFFLQINGTFF